MRWAQGWALAVTVISLTEKYFVEPSFKKYKVQFIASCPTTYGVIWCDIQVATSNISISFFHDVELSCDDRNTTLTLWLPDEPAQFRSLDCRSSTKKIGVMNQFLMLRPENGQCIGNFVFRVHGNKVYYHNIMCNMQQEAL